MAPGNASPPVWSRAPLQKGWPKDMSAYVIALLKITDPTPMDQYRREVGAVVESFEGRYLFAGPGAEALEGDSAPDTMAIIEFPTREDAQRWYDSSDYRPLRELRQTAGFTSMIVTPDTTSLA